MAYGVLINNTSGQSIVDTRTDKLNVVVASGAETCLATTTTVVSGTRYASAIGSGNYTTFGAPDNSIDTIWIATSSGTLSSGRVSPLKIVSAPGITSTTTSSSGIIVTNAPPSNAAKQFNVFMPDNSVVANNNIALANYVATGSRIIEYIAVRF